MKITKLIIDEIIGYVIAAGFIFIILLHLIALIYSVWGPSVSLGDKATIEELQAEIVKLQSNEEFLNSHNITITYNGCEDMREQLGL